MINTRLFLTFLFLFIFSVGVYATHERAGEIIYTHIQGRTYAVKIITYTYAPSPADRPELEIKWGDGTSEILLRTKKVELDPVVRLNEYEGQHTYAGDGNFKMSVEDPNRNYGVVNIPNSVNIPFFIETQLVINPFLGPNNSVQLLNPPLDYGCVNRLYVHNPAAYDPDGDSLSYKLTICRGAGGQPIPGYSLPNASEFFTIDKYGGDLIWQNPVLQGEYNVAFIVEEWRSGVKMGYVTRDMQIQIDACSNEPPVIYSIDDTCVLAGEFLEFDITAIDPNNDKVKLSAKGSPFIQSQFPAVMTPNPAYGNGTVTAHFTWDVKCSHVKKEQHDLYIKAKDTLIGLDTNNFTPLAAYKNIGITVIAPSTDITEIAPLGRTIKLSWNKSICGNALNYFIYRKNSYFGYLPAYCETGVPGYTGYTKIAETETLNDTTFIDDQNGEGLIHGIEYCYMVTAHFLDGAESQASIEWCTSLKKDLPIITQVSVEKTGKVDGEMYIEWSKPTELDTLLTPGPWQYRVLRGDYTNPDFIELATYYNLDDTIFLNTGFDTRDQAYRYRIDFYNNSPDNFFKIGTTVAAPSIFLKADGSDRSVLLQWNNDVPWNNESFTIYRQNKVSLEFDSVGFTTTPFFADTGLINGVIYCYKIKTTGKYSGSGLVDPIINYSQINCAIPVDIIPPCIPKLMVEANCLELKNELTFIYPDSCVEEPLLFNIYYSVDQSADYILIDSTTEFTYTFQTDPPSTVGCFTITALDSLRNESLFSNIVCLDIDACGRIWFPNVFTPNSDGFNDFFLADSVNSIHKLDLKIFNRWGLIVYETTDPFFKWDGTDQNNNGPCSEGVYFYEGIVSEYSLRGPIERNVKGNVTLLR